MNGSFAAADISRIHNIIVDQAKVVKNLQGVGDRQYSFYISAEQLIAQESEHGTEALAAQIHDVFGWFVEASRLAADRVLFAVSFEKLPQILHRMVN
jgi:hypothetical protein